MVLPEQEVEVMGSSDAFVTSNGSLTDNTINILLNFEIEEVGSVSGWKSWNSVAQNSQWFTVSQPKLSVIRAPSS